VSRPQPMHGKTSRIHHEVVLSSELPQEFRGDPLPLSRRRRARTSDLEVRRADDGESMGLRHRRFPVRRPFHPESHPHGPGKALLRNFLGSRGGGVALMAATEPPSPAAGESRRGQSPRASRLRPG